LNPFSTAELISSNKMPSSKWPSLATVEQDWESSDQLMATTDEGAESSDQLAETSNDDSESSGQLLETPNEDLEPTTAPPEYSSVQTAADIESGSSYELRGNMVRRQREVDLESGWSMFTKPRENWIHKIGRVLTLENICKSFGIIILFVVALSLANMLGILLWNGIVMMIKSRQRIND
jgi:hypothetical protein